MAGSMHAAFDGTNPIVDSFSETVLPRGPRHVRCLFHRRRPKLNAPHNAECADQDNGDDMNRFHRCYFLPNELSAGFTKTTRISRVKAQILNSTHGRIQTGLRVTYRLLRLAKAAGN